MTDVVIHRVTTLDLEVERWDWPFANQRRDEIAAHFAAQQHDKPGLWNGRILLGRNARFDNGQFSASYFETDFASLLAWRDWGYPDRAVFNGFGMGALRAADGAFVLGEMGAHTANAGRLYFPAGTPDLADVSGHTLDLAANVAREVEEETGLTPADYRASAHWDCVVTGASVALMRMLDAAETGEVLQRRIEANLAAQDEPELAGVRLVRSRSDLTAAMPRFVTAFLETQFSAGEPSS
ncbi:NUDIX hydrolase [Bradyrhizobium oligotrophicum]|uniref:NUDIX hydrolase n=1 Tax=Bradyrhizobium oligotrophicum TaxID=44255 RepID=UPI003EB9D7D2